jgi:hypothetical protein
MAIDALGADTIDKLLLPVNWQMVKERIDKGMERPTE